MEGVAAFALACNVIQVVDFASKIFSVIHEIHKTGASEENKVLEETTEQLGDLSRKLSTSLGCTQNQSQTKSADIKLQAVASEILKIAAELKSELNHLKCTNVGRRESLRKGWRTFRKKGDIEKLEKRLQNQRSLLDTGLLVHLKYVYILEAVSPTNYLDTGVRFAL
jgi:hypothetical protein